MVVKEIEIRRQMLIDRFCGGQVNVFVDNLTCNGIPLLVIRHLWCFWEG